MRKSSTSTFTLLAALAAASLATATPPKACGQDAGSEESSPELAEHFGFVDLELYKLSRRSSNMICRDFNGDGRIDIALVDNSNSRIDLLLQRPPGKTTDRPDAKLEVNEIISDQRLEHRKLAVDRQIAAMTAGDFNHDGKTDLAYFAVPDRLIIRLQPDMGDWTESTSLRLADVPAAAWSIAGGDLNHDGRDDLVVLGKSVTYVAYQTEQSNFETPQKLFNTSEKLAIAQIVDANGDGRNDLCYRSDAGEEPTLCCRLQNAEGQLGPELEFELPATRGIVLDDLDGEAGSELLAIDGRTGRVRAWQLKQQESPENDGGELTGRLTVYGYGGQGRSRGRDYAAGDVDGDGKNDLILTDPSAAQVIVFRQSTATGLDLGTPFPSLSGTTDVRIADIDGDKNQEVFLLSPQEKTLGVARMQDGRLSFPEPLPIVIRTEDGAELEPQVFELADLDGNGTLEIVYFCEVKKSRETWHEFRALTRVKQQWQPYKFGDKETVRSEIKNSAARLQKLDANGDGRTDLLLFLASDRGTHLFVTNEQGIPSEVQTEGGIQLGEISPGRLFIDDSLDSRILVAQDTFARQLKLDDGSRWKVVDQYNSMESNSRIEGVSALDLDGKPGSEIVLIDTGVKKLRVLREQDNLYQPWKEVELGALAYDGCRVADLNGDGRSDLLLMGRGQFAVLYAGQSSPELTELASFQTQMKNAYFTDLACGDLNNDGRRDLAVIDTRTHQVELLHYSRQRTLEAALHFQVFEEKSFSARGQTGAEPREIQIADVTGDGLADLLLLTHDRLLVYPQDSGARDPGVAGSTDDKSDSSRQTAGSSQDSESSSESSGGESSAATAGQDQSTEK